MVGVGEISYQQVQGVHIFVQRKIPVHCVILGGKIPQGVHVGLVVSRIVQVGAGQRRGKKHQVHAVLLAKFSGLAKIFPSKV